MLINLSNHSSKTWDEKQTKCASQFGNIVDIPFPDIDPSGSSEYIDRLVEEYFTRIIEYKDPVVMLQGEFVFTFRLAVRLKEAGIRVIAGCTKKSLEKNVTKMGSM